jgi:hypothetical protein
MEEASYGDAVVSFINSIAYFQVLHVSSAGRVKGPDSNLWVWSPLRSLIWSHLCEIYIKKIWHACRCYVRCFDICKHEYVNTVMCLKLNQSLRFNAGHAGLCCIRC